MNKKKLSKMNVKQYLSDAMTGKKAGKPVDDITKFNAKISHLSNYKLPEANQKVFNEVNSATDKADDKIEAEGQKNIIKVKKDLKANKTKSVPKKIQSNPPNSKPHENPSVTQTNKSSL